MGGQDSGASAFAAEGAVPSTPTRAANSSPPSITARPSAAEKERFRAAAERAGMSESALALVAIRHLLGAEAAPLTPAAHNPEAVAATDRITIRLRPGDGAGIARRAADRGMKTSAYLAALVRAHLRKNPPLPRAELAALKQAVEILANLSHVLAQMGRRPASGGPGGEAFLRALVHSRAAVETLKQAMHDHAKASLIAWESRND